MRIRFLSIWTVVFSLIVGCAVTSQGVKTKEEARKTDINQAILQISQQISSTMLEKNKRRVAVMDLPLLTGEMTGLGLYLSDKLTNSLFQYRDKFEVVERNRLEPVLKEMELGASGVIDDKTAQSIGKVMGADAIVIGTITDLGRDVDINVRMLGTEQANVLAVASSLIEKDDSITRLIGDKKVAERPKRGPKTIVEKQEIDEEEKRLNEFKALVNRAISTQPGRLNVAMVIESRKTDNGVSPGNSLYNLLRTDKVNIIINLFKEESFKAKGFFRVIYDGDTQLLNQADALSKIDHLILGILNYSCQKGRGIERDLVSCDINFSYKVIGKVGNIVKSDSISIIGPGFSEDQALERGLEMLSEKYSDRILKPL